MKLYDPVTPPPSGFRRPAGLHEDAEPDGPAETPAVDASSNGYAESSGYGVGTTYGSATSDGKGYGPDGVNGYTNGHALGGGSEEGNGSATT